MPAFRRLTLPCIACLALVVAGCGDADKGKLSTKQGAALTKYVETAQAAYDKKSCGTARAAAADGADKVAALKGDVDDALRQNLIDGFNHLGKELAANCAKPEATATATATETATPEATESPTATPSPTPEPTDTPTPEPTTPSLPTATATPNDTGGTDPGDDQGEVPSLGDPDA